MLIEKVSPNEVYMIDCWRHEYGFNEESQTFNYNYASFEKILAEWENRKSEYLYRLFDDELTLTKRIKYERSYEELCDEIYEMTQGRSKWGRIERNGRAFIHAWYDFLFELINLDREARNGLNRLMDNDSLISNTYDDVSFEIPLNNGKKLKINRGCKTIKALGKIAAAFNLEGWEDFRICHSQILNQKVIEGDLTISIHPLDYMTMSDNNYGWDSCMSWSNEGGYRQGTVEMMNSKCVIVAYLSGDEKMCIGGHDWNSKKWRQLFVIDRNLIASVKSYPYQNDFLTKEILKWLKELVEDKIGWIYNDIEECDLDGFYVRKEEHLPSEKGEFTLYFKNGCMYNDFGCVDQHYICFSKNINPDDIVGEIKEGRALPYLAIEYSGKSQCMICGKLSPELEDESCLACNDCQGRIRCDCCGELIGESYTVDGYELCQWCYENRVYECPVCEEEHFEDSMISMQIIPELTEEHVKTLRDHYMDINEVFRSLTDAQALESDFNYRSDTPAIWICEDCVEEWIEKFLKPGERPHLREWEYRREENCVYFNQLNEAGIIHYFFGSEIKTNEDYIESFYLYQSQPTKFKKLL